MRKKSSRKGNNNKVRFYHEQVILAGRLTKDIEMRYTQTGKAIARFILSVNRRVSKDKEKQQADFIPIIVWNKLAEICSKYLTKEVKY